MIIPVPHMVKATRRLTGEEQWLTGRQALRVTQVESRTWTSWLVADNRINERFRVKWRQVVRALAEPDQFHRHAKFMLYRDHDAALGRSVELGQDDPGDIHDLGEHFRLPQAVLPGRGVEHEQHLVHGPVPGDHPLDL